MKSAESVYEALTSQMTLVQCDQIGRFIALWASF